MIHPRYQGARKWRHHRIWACTKWSPTNPIYFRISVPAARLGDRMEAMFPKHAVWGAIPVYHGIPWYTMVYHDVQTQIHRWCWVNKLHFKHLDTKSTSSRVKLPISLWQRISMWVYLRQNEPTSPWRSAPVAGAHFALANCLLQPGQQHEENQRGTPDHPDAGPAGNEIETMAHPGMLWDLTK